MKAKVKPSLLGFLCSYSWGGKHRRGLCTQRRELFSCFIWRENSSGIKADRFASTISMMHSRTNSWKRSGNWRKQCCSSNSKSWYRLLT